MTGRASNDSSTICWRRVDAPGHEVAELQRRGDGWRLHGVVLLVDGARPLALEYTVTCGADWETRQATIATLVGDTPRVVSLARHSNGAWAVDGLPRADLRECVDVDLAFTPATNLLPIRRLGLRVGEDASVRAAWLRFPQFTVEVLEQVYRRTAPSTYRYESAGGAFVRDLIVDYSGFVLDYPGLWTAER
jgi:hypothetical protein